jgi:hypothetical protein
MNSELYEERDLEIHPVANSDEMKAACADKFSFFIRELVVCLHTSRL